MRVLVLALRKQEKSSLEAFWLSFKLKRSGPFSYMKPSNDEQPGPPFSLRIKGAVECSQTVCDPYETFACKPAACGPSPGKLQGYICAREVFQRRPPAAFLDSHLGPDNVPHHSTTGSSLGFLSLLTK